MSRTALLGTFVFVVAGLSGCASPAKVIKSDMTTAVIAVPDDTNTWPFYYRDAAQAAAAERISEPFLVATNRVKVGELTTSTQDQSRQDIGGVNRPKVGEVLTSTNRTSTSDAYEYHLEFQSRRPRQTTVTTRSSDLPPTPTPGGPLPPLPTPNGLTLNPNSSLPPMPTPNGLTLNPGSSLPPMPTPNGLTLNPGSSLPPTVTPASGTTPRYELPPANDIRMPSSTPPSPMNLPSTNITVPMGSGR